MPGLDAALLARELGERIAALAAELLPQGRLVRGMWRAGSLSGEAGQSLCVWLAGPKRGRWCDFASGEHGDALDLLAQIRCRGDKRRAVREARAWLGLGSLDPEAAAELARKAALRAAASRREAEARERNRRHDAFAIWRAARPLARGDPAWRYLDGRGIDIAGLAAARGGATLGALRCHPGLWHPSGKAWPAMVALIAAPDGRPLAIHRTWLAERNLAFEDRPTIGKAPVDEPKMSLGGYAGGLIRLWRGEAANGRAWKDAEDGESLILSEGIEDLLSYLGRDRRHRAACAVALGNMLRLELPPAFGRIGILAQNDPAGSPAAALLARAVDRFRAEGRRVFVWRPPVFVKDANDLIRHRVNSCGGER